MGAYSTSFSYVRHRVLLSAYFFFFFNDTATTEIYTLSLHDALPISNSAFRIRSRRRPSPRIQVLLQHQRRRERVDVVLPPPRLPAHLPHRRQHARRGEPLVPQRHRQPRLPADGGGDLAGRSRGCAFVAPLVERQAHHHARHRMGLEQGDQLAHGEALAGPAGQGRERLRERLGFVGARDADALLAPVDGEQATGGWQVGLLESWNVSPLFQPSLLPTFYPSSLRHRPEELHVVLRALESLEQELDRLDGGHVGEEVAEQVDLVELFLREKQLFLAGAGALHVYGREGAPLGDPAVEDHLRVARALELLEDHLVHARSGVDQRGRHNGERAARLDVAGRAEEPLRLLERVRVHAARQRSEEHTSELQSRLHLV